MSDRLIQLEAAVAEMRESVVLLEQRIAQLEHGYPRASGPSLEPEKLSGASLRASEIQGPLAVMMGTPALIGRSFLVLAGAFLLRALTEGGTFAPRVGVAAGVAYAAIWIVASAKAARKGSRASAGFYAASSAVIVGPLLFEAVTSFNVLSPAAGLVTLALMTGGGLVVAARWRLQSTAWIFSVTGSVTGAAIATMRPPGESATAFLVVLGLVVLWLAGARDWGFLKWVSALVADLAVLRLTAIAVASGVRPEDFGPVHPPVVAMLQVVLVVGYVGTAVVQAVRGGRPLTVFAFVQTTLVWLVGWGGGVQLARVHGWETVALSAFAVLAGLAAYWGAFGVVDRREGRNRAFFYLSYLGLGLLLLGLPGVLGHVSVVVWSVLAVAVAAVGSRWDRVTLRVHAAALLVAGWLVSGIGQRIAMRLAGLADGGVASLEAVLVAVLTVVTTLVVLFGTRLRATGWVQRLPLTGLLAMTALVAAAVVARGMGSLLGSGTTRVAGTVALSAITVGLAIVASRRKIPEAGWLVYPFLGVTGVRMIAVDFSSGHTVVLVIALTAYGATLIAATRLLRGARVEVPPQ